MVCEGSSFWRNKKGIKKRQAKIISQSAPKKAFVDSDDSEGSQDAGTNKLGLTGRQALLARLASGPIKSCEWQCFHAVGYCFVEMQTSSL